MQDLRNLPATGAIGVFLGTQSAQMGRLQIAFPADLLFYARLLACSTKVNKSAGTCITFRLIFRAFIQYTLLAIALLRWLWKYAGMVMAFRGERDALTGIKYPWRICR